MTRPEYITYQEKVAEFFKREGLNNLSVVYKNDNPCKSHYFSWSGCDCCGSLLGGNRWDCNGFNPTTKKIQDGYRVCPDCIYFNEYHTLDDQTMIDMDN